MTPWSLVERIIRLLCVLSVAGIAALAASRSGVMPVHATFPGENGRIAFTSSNHVMTVRADGTDPQDLGIGIRPRWSADGSKIAFEYAGIIYVMNADGFGRTKIASQLVCQAGNVCFEVNPTWSPDGSQLAFFGYTGRGSDSGLWLMNADGSGQHPILTDDQYYDGGGVAGVFDWSPDGGEILFVGNHPNSNHTAYVSDIYSIHPNGTGLANLTNTEPPDQNYFSRWSPDGSKILIESSIGGASVFRVLDRNNSGPAVVLGPAGGGPSGFSWSPDGSKVVYAIDNALHIMDSNGQNDVPLGVTGYVPDWGPFERLKVEFTQVIQQLQSLSGLDASLAANGQPPVPIVEGKPAAMRVIFGQVQTSTDYVVRVNGIFSSQLRTTLTPGCTANDRREQKNNCGSIDFYFTPPHGTWTEHLTVEDPLTGNTVLQHDFRITSVTMAPFMIRYIPVCVVPVPGEPPTCPSSFVSGQAADLMKKMYPLSAANLDYSQLPVPSINLDDRITNRAAEDDLIASLRLRYNLMSLGSAVTDQLVGWLPAFGATTTTGLSDPVWLGSTGRVSWELDESSTDQIKTEHTLTHEVAHNLGLRHVNLSDGCGAKDPNTDWPYADSTIQETGFDVGAQKAVPASKFDMMSYCNSPGTNIWISPFDYKKLVNGNFQPQSVDGAHPAAAGPSQFLLVKGTAQANGSAATIDSAYAITSSLPADTAGPDANYCLHFTGGATQDSCFTLEFVDHKSHEPVSSESFSVRVPLPDGTTHVGLMHGTDELAALDASDNAPSVQIARPPEAWNGQATLAWTGSDADSDPLKYAVMYSPDNGATWLPIDVDETNQSFTFDTSVLQGQQILIKVLASDGLHTTIATSDPITVNHGPSRLWGDINCDDMIDGTDLLALLQSAAGLDAGAPVGDCPGLGVRAAAGFDWGDLNCDNRVDALDDLYALAHEAGLDLPHPPACPAVGTSTT